MGRNILQGGIQEIEKIKEEVMELNERTQQKQTLQEKEVKAEKSISQKEDAIEDEIKKVTKQRKAQLEATFDEQIDSLTEKLKKVESKREKAKKKAMLQRADEETADFRSEAEELHLAGKSVFKQEHIPGLYNNRLFFALYFPQGMGDIGIIFLTLAITFFALPFGLYYILFESGGMLYLALSYILVILVFGGLYLVIGKTKYKHLEALNRVRKMRREIEESKKRQRKIKREIMKDKDESVYDLEEFDKEIGEYKEAIGELMEQKNKALVEFDHTTAEEIKQQIKGANEEALKALKAEYDEVYRQGKENMEKLNKLSVTISTEYEGVIGKESLKVSKLEEMEEAMKAGNAKTIGEAMEFLASADSDSI